MADKKEFMSAVPEEKPGSKLWRKAKENPFVPLGRLILDSRPNTLDSLSIKRKLKLNADHPCILTFKLLHSIAMLCLN